MFGNRLSGTNLRSVRGLLVINAASQERKARHLAEAKDVADLLRERILSVLLAASQGPHQAILLAEKRVATLLSEYFDENGATKPEEPAVLLASIHHRVPLTNRIV